VNTALPGTAAVHRLFRSSAVSARAMSDHPPKDLGPLVASLVFASVLVALLIIGAVLLIAG
jgi:hypothetical protein